MGNKWETVFSLSSAKGRIGLGRGGAFRWEGESPREPICPHQFGGSRGLSPSPCPLPAALRSEREKASKVFWPRDLIPHRCSAALVVAVCCALRCAGWDYEGHKFVNQSALAALPTNFPSFVFTEQARERIGFLGGEPDRWRNSPDLPFKHAHGPDHYLDLDELPFYGLQARELSPFRYEFAAQLAIVRALNPEKFRPLPVTSDPDRTKAWIGFLPWAISEHFSRLKSSFSYLKVYEEFGMTADAANARQNIIYTMGVLGHYVGDATQPLHLTRHFNGWVGDNPHGYTTNRGFHAWIDGGYLFRAGKDWTSAPPARPARLLHDLSTNAVDRSVFPEVMDFLLREFAMVEPLYRLEKEGKLSGEGAVGIQGEAFLSNQLRQASQMLGDLWLTAWREAPPDLYLRNQLTNRKGRTPSRKP